MHSAADRLLFALILFAAPALSAQVMPPGQETALVQRYCAVCHTDAVRNGGLSLQHYDAAQLNAPLAAMLLAKLNGGAMGAAGIPIPDKPTREAWVAATTAQAEGANVWAVTRAEAPESKASVVVAGIVRTVAPRSANGDAPLYRLTVSCNTTTRQGEIQLAWAPQPQTDRTFFVSADGAAGIPHKLQGREEKMGNGVLAPTGLAAATLHVPMPRKTLAITDLFPGETVEFPITDLGPVARLQLTGCFTGARE